MKIILSFYIILLTIKPADEGMIVLGFCIIILLIGGLYIVLIENPNQENEKNEWLKNNKWKMDSQIILDEVFQKAGKLTPPCKKCNSIELQLWDINNNEITLRCTTCKNKFKVNVKIHSLNNNEDDSIDFNRVLNVYIDLIVFTLKQQNTRLGIYLRDYLKWNFFNLRKGTPLYRGITFNSNPNFIHKEGVYDDIKNDEPSRRISQIVMDKVWNRDNGKCIVCGSNEKLEFDHIIPFSKGGSNTYRNIQLLCEKCNRTKSDKIG